MALDRRETEIYCDKQASSTARTMELEQAKGGILMALIRLSQISSTEKFLSGRTGSYSMMVTWSDLTVQPSQHSLCIKSQDCFLPLLRLLQVCCGKFPQKMLCFRKLDVNQKLLYSLDNRIFSQTCHSRCCKHHFQDG